jgi:transcriptional regulator with XRE-family HTH domain
MSKTDPNSFLDESLKSELRALGQRLKLARARRKLTLANVAERTNLDERTISRAEQGYPGTSMKALMQMLSAYGLESSLSFVASLEHDKVGQSLDLQNLPKRVHPTYSSELDNDF